MAGLVYVVAHLMAISGPARAAEIAIACSSTGMDRKSCAEGAQSWAAATGNTVRIVSTPPSSTERLALYQQFLAAGAADIDVYTVDVIWPGLLGKFLVDLTPYIDAPRRAAYAPALLANNTVAEKLVALPWFADAGVLFYRRDLLLKYHLEVPRTWDELQRAARTIQKGERAGGRPRFWGFVWQGRADESLTCNALEWIDSFGGGRIVAEDGRIDIDNPHAVAALTMARGWINTISPPGVLSYGEEDARGVFQSGDAAFMRNWPYAWSLAQAPDSPVRGRVAVAPLPKGPGPRGRASAVLGGWQLAVSKFSRHPQESVDLVLHLTSLAEQKRRAIVYTYNPTMPELYKDAEVLAAAPFLGRLRSTFAHAIARPSATTQERYGEVSAAFRASVHTVLAGEDTAANQLSQLSGKLRRLSRGGRW